MKKIFLLVVLLLGLFSVGAVNIHPVKNILKETEFISSKIQLEKKTICETKFYNELKPVYGDCIEDIEVVNCLNTTGPDTDCRLEKPQNTVRCKLRDESILKNKNLCKPDDKFIISIDEDKAILKKQLDFSEFGPCIYEEKNDCLIVTCQSRFDGAHSDQFSGCRSGTSCQKFEICDGSIKTFYKNSRDDFALVDETFHLKKLSLGEVEE
jgi:hypothetical protein